MLEFKWLKPQNQIVRDLGFNMATDKLMAETAARYMNQFVPMDTGTLSQNYETGVDAFGGYVKYTSPYARPQYYNDGFVHNLEQHPLATDHWDKAMMIAQGMQFTNEVNKIRKANSK